MFNKILIANRGEIACRVAATARRMAIRTVAVYSDADAHAKHVAACDESVHIGGNAPKDSYLRWERIIEAALATGAQAIHPGYGFLSENEDFARACAEAGLVFIGPPPSAIKDMGLKAESKQLMERAGVPLVPGYHGANQDTALLQAEADRIGYPVLIKASAGGWGQGHARGRQGRGLPGRAGELPARGEEQLRRRGGADREVRAAPAPH
jgi:3-methylcrotonyl-CoA carboxylase alpha subunit